MLPLPQRVQSVRWLILDVDGVLTDGRLWYGVDGEGLKCFHVRDGSAIQLWHAAGRCTAIVSGRRHPAVRQRAAELNIAEVYEGVTDKGAALHELCRRHRLVPEQLCAIGDDWLDVPLFRQVAVRAVPADASPYLRQLADYQATAYGGGGVVSEVVEWLLRQQGEWERALQRFLDRSCRSDRMSDRTEEPPSPAAVFPPGP